MVAYKLLIHYFIVFIITIIAILLPYRHRQVQVYHMVGLVMLIHCFILQAVYYTFSYNSSGQLMIATIFTLSTTPLMQGWVYYMTPLLQNWHIIKFWVWGVVVKLSTILGQIIKKHNKGLDKVKKVGYNNNI